MLLIIEWLFQVIMVYNTRVLVRRRSLCVTYVVKDSQDPTILLHIREYTPARDPSNVKYVQDALHKLLHLNHIWLHICETGILCYTDFCVEINIYYITFDSFPFFIFVIFYSFWKSWCTVLRYLWTCSMFTVNFFNYPLLISGILSWLT